MYIDGFAFPYVAAANETPAPMVNGGMTVRQYAAIHLMAGILANPHNGVLTLQDCANMARDAVNALGTTIS